MIICSFAASKNEKHHHGPNRKWPSRSLTNHWKNIKFGVFWILNGLRSLKNVSFGGSIMFHMFSSFLSVCIFVLYVSRGFLYVFYMFPIIFNRFYIFYTCFWCFLPMPCHRSWCFYWSLWTLIGLRPCGALDALASPCVAAGGWETNWRWWKIMM